MSIPEEEVRRFLPQEQGASHAFDTVKDLHFRATSSLDHFLRLPKETQETIVDDYLRAAFTYFANNAGNEYLEEVGTTAWHEINMSMSPDPAKIVNRKYISGDDRTATRQHFPNDETQGLLIDFDTSTNKVRSATLVVSSHFPVAARSNPLGVLAGFLYQLSAIRDVVNHDGRSPLRQRDLNTRADILEAQFWLGVDPQERGNRERPRTLLGLYKRGTLDMPSRLRYQGKHHPRRS